MPKYANAPDPYVHDLLTDAANLLERKAALSEEVNANRSLLRNLRTAGKASKDQADAISAFYADRERKPKPANK